MTSRSSFFAVALALGGSVFLACAGNDDVTIPPVTGTPDGSTTPPVGDASSPDDELPTLDAGADADAGPAVDPLDLGGLAEKTWKWFDIPGATCRDGSQAGFGLSLGAAASASKMMIFLEGGGACFNPITCGTNPAKVGGKSANGGILDRTRTENPVADWTYVYVPYCTGDVHAGNNPAGTVANVGGTQRFVGYANMGLYLQKLVATFPQTARVLLTGVSAGGFGAAANYGQTAKAFPDVPVNLVDDSGPAMRSPALARCLQDQWSALWKLDTTLIAECGADCVGKPDALFAAGKEWTKRRPNDAQGLISATGDQTIRFFFGFGLNECKPVIPLMSETDYAAGLADVRTGNPATNFGTLAYADTRHTVLGSSEFYSTAAGRPFASWVRAIVESNTVTNVGP